MRSLRLLAIIIYLLYLSCSRLFDGFIHAMCYALLGYKIRFLLSYLYTSIYIDGFIIHTPDDDGDDDEVGSHLLPHLYKNVAKKKRKNQQQSELVKCTSSLS